MKNNTNGKLTQVQFAICDSCINKHCLFFSLKLKQVLGYKFPKIMFCKSFIGADDA